MLRIFLFLLLGLLAVNVTIYILLAACAVYAFFWFAPELILLALIIDVYFGNLFLPQYLLYVLLLLLVVEFLRPRFLHYT